MHLDKLVDSYGYEVVSVQIDVLDVMMVYGTVWQVTVDVSMVYGTVAVEM